MFLLFVQEDYKLLETMNKVTMQKYASYRQIASDVGKQILVLNEKCMFLFLVNCHLFKIINFVNIFLLLFR